jgi:hypothetical protein
MGARYESKQIHVADVVVDVEYEVTFEAGYLHDGDGHGLPPSLEVEIMGIFIGDVDVYDLVTFYAKDLHQHLLDCITEDLHS